MMDGLICKFAARCAIDIRWIYYVGVGNRRFINLCRLSNNARAQAEDHMQLWNDLCVKLCSEVRWCHFKVMLEKKTKHLYPYGMIMTLQKVWNLSISFILGCHFLSSPVIRVFHLLFSFIQGTCYIPFLCVRISWRPASFLGPNMFYYACTLVNFKVSIEIILWSLCWTLFCIKQLVSFRVNFRIIKFNYTPTTDGWTF